ncbi:MAG: hypoxanthine phosphoribosyltransferase [Rhodothermales bacterium]
METGPNGSGDAAANAVSFRGERFDLYLDRQRIQRRVDEMGAAVSDDYAGKTPILIGVLNGSFIFLADLMRSITIDCEVDFWKLSSYGARKVSSGDVTELKKVDAELAGRHVIVVEDIVDTGLSIEYVVQRIQDYGPASLRVATLLHKPEATASEVELDYVGFRIPDRFVIGYGLDFGQLGRNLPEIYIQSDEQVSRGG